MFNAPITPSRFGSRAMTDEELQDFLKHVRYGTLSYTGDEGWPDSRVFNFGLLNGKFYFHSHKVRGEKLPFISNGQKACISFYEPSPDVGLMRYCPHRSAPAFGAGARGGGVAGVVIMNLGGDVSGGVRLTGEGFLLLSMIASACSAGTIKLFSAKEAPVALSGWQFMLGGAIMAAVGLLLGGRLQPTGISAPMVLLYLAALSAVAYTVWALLLKYNPVSRIAPYMFLQPIFGVVLSLLFYGGADTPLLRCGAALVLVCLSIVIVGKGQQEA